MRNVIFWNFFYFQISTLISSLNGASATIDVQTLEMYPIKDWDLDDYQIS